MADDETDPPPLEDPFADSDEWIAAEGRQLFRALVGYDPKAVEVALFYLTDFLAKTLGRHLRAAGRWDIPTEHFEAFVHFMAMDLTVTDYATYEDLFEYVYGWASVIGLQVLPVLEPTSPDAAQYAVDLGVAFQLVNFVRDVGEDLDRGRVYLPADELARFGVDREVLSRREATPQVRRAVAFQVQRVRELADRSRAGVALLAPSSRPCIDAARELYCGIADEVERAGYDVFSRRATVPKRRRIARFVRAWTAARLHS